MFGNQLDGSPCGFPTCGAGGCVQQKYFVAEVQGATACGDLSNAVAYINSNFSTLSPLSLAWASHPIGWQYEISIEFDAPSDTTPDSGETETSDTQVTSGEEYPNSSIYQLISGENGEVVRTAFLLPDSTAYIVGSWQSEGCDYAVQQTCQMTGVATGCGYVFDIPIPDPSLCLTGCLPTSEAYYTFYTVSTYSGYFADYLWSANCSAFPGGCSPGACMSGDPFFGDEP